MWWSATCIPIPSHVKFDHAARPGGCNTRFSSFSLSFDEALFYEISEQQRVTELWKYAVAGAISTQVFVIIYLCTDVVMSTVAACDIAFSLETAYQPPMTISAAIVNTQALERLQGCDYAAFRAMIRSHMQLRVIKNYLMIKKIFIDQNGAGSTLSSFVKLPQCDIEDKSWCIFWEMTLKKGLWKKSLCN